MDDNMVDDSSPSSSVPPQRFNIADMLSESNRSTFDSMSGALTASATVDAGSILSVGSRYHEQKDELTSHRLRILYPFLDHKKDPLPRYWNSNNKISQHLSVSTDYLRVYYRGKSSHRADAKDAALVRANRPIPTLSIVYYFEIYIVNKDNNGLISIGLCDKNVPVNRLPGWDENSYGYHGIDGNFMANGSAGQKFGSKYTTGDVIGCGLNFITRELFFTKNGGFEGVATRDIRTSDRLYPSVGMQSANETIDANFGQKPFKYDINAYVEDAQSKIMKTIRNISLPFEKAIWTNRIVSDWLEHEGYSRALNAFHVAVGATSSVSENLANQPDGGNVSSAASTFDTTRHSATRQLSGASAGEEMENRRAISRLIQLGKTNEAIKEVEQLYPTLLTSNKELALLLKIQQYVEMIVDVTKDCQSRKNISSNSELLNDLCGGPSTSSLNATQSLLKRSAAPHFMENGRNALKRRSSEEDHDPHQSPRRFHHHPNVGEDLSPAVSESPDGANLSADDDEPMDVGRSRANSVEDGLNAVGATNGNATNGCVGGLAEAAVGAPPTSTTIVEEYEELTDNLDGVGADDSGPQENGYLSPENLRHLQKYLPIIELGHSISQFSQRMSTSSTSPKLLKRMNNAFSLIGYADPTQSNHSYLMSPRERLFVAKALNKAVLDEMGKERYSQLDLYIRKTRVDRNRSTPFSIAAVFADVDRLLFCRSASAQAFNRSDVSRIDASTPSETSPIPDADEDSNSSGRGSSMGAEPKI